MDEIDTDDIRQFLIEREVSAKCPRCSHDKWTLSKSPSPWGGLWGSNQSAQYTLDAPIHPVAMLICNNCGFVSLHSKHFISLWKTSKEKR